VVCVRAPALAVSGPDGQLRGHGTDGFYRDGVRLLSRLRLRIGGTEPQAVQARRTGPGQARFLAVHRVAGDPDPDPAVTVERERRADGVERITVRHAGRTPLRTALELEVGTDLGALPGLTAPAAAAGDAAGAGDAACPQREPEPRLHPGGLSWSSAPSARTPARCALLTARPSPHTVVAAAGRLHWDLDLPPGARWTVELRITAGEETPDARPGRRPRTYRGEPLWSRQPDAPVSLECEHPGTAELLGNSLAELDALLLADSEYPADAVLAAGAPWRLGPSPVEALHAARMLLPLGTRLATGTLRALARRQIDAPGAASGSLPGAFRHAGPLLPPAWTGGEATLLYVTVLAEAVRWGMPEREAGPLLPAAGRCLGWLRTAAAGDGLVWDPPGPDGRRLARVEMQAMAHRAAWQGADLLDAFGRPGAGRWREWAAVLRKRCAERFWIDDARGGRPAAALHGDGAPLDVPASTAVHLLDAGLAAGATTGEGLLDPVRTELLAQRLSTAAMDSGWGLRTLAADSPRFSPLGHRGGAVRVFDTAVAAEGLFAHGHGRAGAALLHGLLAAAECFERRLPEMYGGEQRAPGTAPLTHPRSCYPDALAAASVVRLLTGVAGIRPDAPAGRVALAPADGMPLGEIRLGGLELAGRPFAVRVGRSGLGLVEQAAEGIRLTGG
jgi:hypothetical protein